MKYIIVVVLSAALTLLLMTGRAPVTQLNNSVGRVKARAVQAETPRKESTRLADAKLQEKAPTEQQAAPKPEKPVLTQTQQWMQDAGIAPADWSAVSYIVSHESGWCPHKWEGDIGYCPSEYREKYSNENQWRGYGLCQSTPAIKMARIADDWRDNAVTQLKWCASYAQARYGGWQAAYVRWVSSHNW